MGDIFFIIRMTIYTFFIVLIMQIKIGPRTVEDRVIDFTHESEFASLIKETAQGAVTFVGVQYNRLTGHVSSDFIKQHSRDQRPGERLKAKIDQLRKSIKTKARKEKQRLQEGIRDVSDDFHHDSYHNEESDDL